MTHSIRKPIFNTTWSNLTEIQSAKSKNATTTVDEYEEMRQEFSLVRDSGETSRLSNWSNHLYAELFNTIIKMGELPEGSELHLEPEATQNAVSVLAFVKEQMTMLPPRMLNQDGEAVSFTWNIGNLKRYLTVSEDEVDLMHLSNRFPIRCEEVLSEGKEIDYQNLFTHLAELPRSTSSETVD